MGLLRKTTSPYMTIKSVLNALTFKFVILKYDKKKIVFLIEYDQ